MLKHIWKIGVLIILLNYCSSDEGPPSILSISANKVLDIGNTLTLDCQVDNIGNYYVIWTKIKKWEERTPITVGTQLVYPDSRFHLSIDNQTQTYTLKINFLEPNDSAVYECHINIIGGNNDKTKQQVDVVIREPPQINTFKSTNSTTLELGRSDDLICSADGFPKPQITWRRENNKIFPFGGIKYNGSMLKLQNVTSYDRGIYICEAENGVGSVDRKLIEVKVIFSPHVTTRWPKIGQAIGNSVNLYCIATGYPTVVLDWKRNGEIIRNSDNLLIEFNGHYYDTAQSSLTIQSINESQYGDYYCEASNVLGVATKRIHVFQTKKPVIYNSSLDYGSPNQ